MATPLTDLWNAIFRPRPRPIARPVPVPARATAIQRQAIISTNPRTSRASVGVPSGSSEILTEIRAAPSIQPATVDSGLVTSTAESRRGVESGLTSGR